MTKYIVLNLILLQISLTSAIGMFVYHRKYSKEEKMKQEIDKLNKLIDKQRESENTGFYG